MSDPIPSAVRAVLDLFANELAPLQFGDLEAGVLASAAEQVISVADTVARAEADLDRARMALAEKQQVLLQTAQRALAYARVYAENQPELASRIDHIALPRASRRAVKMESVEVGSPGPVLPASSPRRGRPRKAGPTDALVEERANAASVG